MRLLEYEEYKIKKEECDRLYEEVEPWIAEFPADEQLIESATEEMKAKYRRMIELSKEISWYEDYHGLSY